MCDGGDILISAGHWRPLLPQSGTVHRGEAQRLRQGALRLCCCAGRPHGNARRQVGKQHYTQDPNDIYVVLSKKKMACSAETSLTTSFPVYVDLFVPRMDSFFLAEMFKYLYLLFSEKSELPIDIDDFIFTTEAHLLPMSLSTTRPPCQGNKTVRASLTLCAMLSQNEIALWSLLFYPHLSL